jgi:hypothetical protein
MREEPQTLTVMAPVPHWRICTSETMHALPDPAHPDQAVFQNVPFFVDGLNFGDVVRLGPPDELGVRPIEAVVTTNGHVRFLALTGPLAIPNSPTISRTSSPSTPSAPRATASASWPSASIPTWTPTTWPSR